MSWWRTRQVQVKRGQRWRKRQTVHDKPFTCIIVGKSKGDGIKAFCSDRCTHSFSKRVFFDRFELIE